jgi:asparagine synthase (glutamine-hydrolysing)
MLAALEHRGPDDCGTFTAGAGTQSLQVWLGSRRLAIQDLSPAGRQPMVDPGTQNAIAFNGEIYNFPDLRARLEQAGGTFCSRCDTEVALRSWSLEGLAAVRRWRGMFAAALWDSRRQELWLVRDAWGIKPLYYHAKDGGVAFCSEVRGLLAGGMTPPLLSRRGVEDYLRFGAVQDPVTIIDGIYALLPGYALRWAAGAVEIRRYAERSLETMEPEAVGPMIEQIVKQQLISDRPVVVFLSGGIDSSVVALAARRAAGRGVHTMSVVFDESRYSEARHARQVAARLGTEHHEVRLRGEEARAKASQAIARMDQPTVDGVNTYVIAEAARQAGFTVALSGLGGDEFFGGYPSFFRTGRLRRLQRLARRAPGAAAAAGKALRRLPWETAGKLGLYLEEGNFWEHPYFLQRTLFFPRQADALLASSPDGNPEAERMAAARLQSVMQEAEEMDALNQISLLEARLYMGNMLLRDSDQMSMAHSLELRVPLVDHILAARLLATPGEQKGFGRAQKLWLRQAFARALPEEVFSRKKMGFTLPFALWLKGPLRQQVEETLARGCGPLWNPAAVEAVWSAFLRGQAGWSRPWALYVLTRWAARHIHGETSDISGVKSTT